MSEQAILNENATWDDDIQDNICPDYGFGNKLATTRVTAKPPGGQPSSRETQNSGHTFSLSWLNRSYECVQRVRHFHQLYEDGYFTLIDHDGGGRHYVGRFTGEFNLVQGANDSYSIQNLTFEEVPGVPMLEYPADWENDAIDILMFSDFGQQRASVTGTWTQASHNGVTNTLDSAGVANDSATIEYRGYGFELVMIQGPAFGQVQVSLDTTVLGSVDLYSAAQNGPVSVFAKGDVPLDLHRVTVTVLGTKNASSSSTAASWVSLKVMR